MNDLLNCATMWENGVVSDGELLSVALCAVGGEGASVESVVAELPHSAIAAFLKFLRSVRGDSMDLAGSCGLVPYPPLAVHRVLEWQRRACEFDAPSRTALRQCFGPVDGPTWQLAANHTAKMRHLATVAAIIRDAVAGMVTP
jgi:hypothetical protein